MPTLEHCIAVDWRAGKDRIYFFFKDTDTYSRFNISEREVPSGYPSSVKGRWSSFDNHVKNLRFGFSTTGMTLDKPMDTSDLDILWLFYYDGDTPMVCAYNQDTDSIMQSSAVKSSKWRLLLPYFDRIIAGTWWQTNRRSLFRFIMNDGDSLYLDWDEVPQTPQRNYADDKYDNNLFKPVVSPAQSIAVEAISDFSWPGLAPYKNRIITAAQHDRTFADSYYYIFLTHNQYLIYNIAQNHLVSGPHAVDDQSWPGLLRNR